MQLWYVSSGVFNSESLNEGERGGGRNDRGKLDIDACCCGSSDVFNSEPLNEGERGRGRNNRGTGGRDNGYRMQEDSY